MKTLFQCEPKKTFLAHEVTGDDVYGDLYAYFVSTPGVDFGMWEGLTREGEQAKMPVWTGLRRDPAIPKTLLPPEYIGHVLVSKGDFILGDPLGGYRVVRPDVFASQYQVVERK